jgi:hypothetical protein
LLYNRYTGRELYKDRSDAIIYDQSQSRVIDFKLCYRVVITNSSRLPPTNNNSHSIGEKWNHCIVNDWKAPLSMIGPWTNRIVALNGGNSQAVATSFAAHTKRRAQQERRRSTSSRPPQPIEGPSLGQITG